jgi:hypothetical protein
MPETSPASFLRKPRRTKRLVLCLDGTWNSDDGEKITNIVRIRDLIDPEFQSPDGSEIWQQRVFYHTGVGTGLTQKDKVFGGATGAGLDENVRHAYRYLSDHYEPGIEIFIFGFSRGAFTARSVAGYLGSSGLLRPENCTRQTEERAWKFYRTPPNKRFPRESRDLAELCFPDVRVRLLGVFDTVGALGIPVELFVKGNRKRFAFHDVTLGSNVDYALHAVSIDEKRGPFGASLWQYPNHRSFEWVEQVWFPGVHSNVGGGYPNYGLSNVTLKWMLSRIEAKGLGLRFLPNWKIDVIDDPLEPMNESRTALYTYSKFYPLIRVINQSGSRLPAGARLSALPPHARPLGEMLHWTALYRLKVALERSGTVSDYNPINVDAALRDMFNTSPARRPNPIPIVGEDGDPLDWLTNLAERDKVARLLPNQYLETFKAAIDQFEMSGADTAAFIQPYQQPRPSAAWT